MPSSIEFEQAGEENSDLIMTIWRSHSRGGRRGQSIHFEDRAEVEAAIAGLQEELKTYRKE